MLCLVLELVEFILILVWLVTRQSVIDIQQ